MRGYLVNPIGVAVSAALALPLSLSSGTPATAAPAGGARPAAPAAGPGPSGLPGPPGEPPGPTAGIPGSTHSIALSPPAPASRAAAPTLEHSLLRPQVAAFSLVGVVWADPAAELDGTVEVRTRRTGTGRWTRWQRVQTHQHDHGADPGTAEHRAARGATVPLWTGPSRGVEVRVRPRAAEPFPTPPLPQGLRLELVDPGRPGTAARPEAEPARAPGQPAALPAAPAAKPFIGPRPRIVTRKGWGASESLRETGFVYTKKVKAAFVHHSATGNNYTCKQSPSVLRGIYRYHVVSSGWRDIGYNFAVDKCGNIYEGRAGGVTKAVRGAHTLGFNTDSMGIAVLGSYSRSTPPPAAVTAIARLTAWKLGLFQGNPKGKVTLTSGGSGKYAKGRKIRFNVISGHRDGFRTDCPGTRLYNKLSAARSAAAGYQGR
ncbi:peptidoglycan recognition protein family protein [Streptomyces yaizuensis]|uniref:N-acetylmuramoyl-L-alanine amidase n=1 Tax=Streptomyces yaizuensis TaxID=2989713 RepID=A0ABQ5P9G5_9ACTN|nr:peptidoglycan recognition protein [Streptomyces sp. YSPA8]GLF99235.1 N-acetylmuramoyl-L-alanine amidase [Streptomyces sp. YSPA8]